MGQSALAFQSLIRLRQPSDSHYDPQQRHKGHVLRDHAGITGSGSRKGTVELVGRSCPSLVIEQGFGVAENTAAPAVMCIRCDSQSSHASCFDVTGIPRPMASRLRCSASTFSATLLLKAGLLPPWAAGWNMAGNNTMRAVRQPLTQGSACAKVGTPETEWQPRASTP